MLELIRTSFQKFVSNTTAFLTHISKGRPGEGVGGKFFQHYGFRSIPPEGTDLVTLQDGNNNYSIAENYSSVKFGGLLSGDVLLYSTTGGKNPNAFLNLSTDEGTDQGNVGIEAFDANDRTKFSLIAASPDSVFLETPSLLLELDELFKKIHLGANSGSGQDSLVISGSDSTGTLDYVATAAFVTAVQAFMTTISSATTAAQIAAAAVTFNGVLSTVFTTQNVKAK